MTSFNVRDNHSRRSVSLRRRCHSGPDYEAPEGDMIASRLALLASGQNNK